MWLCHLNYNLKKRKKEKKNKTPKKPNPQTTQNMKFSKGLVVAEVASSVVRTKQNSD